MDWTETQKPGQIGKENMAKKTNESIGDVEQAFRKDSKFKSYKKDGTASFDELEEGGEVTGVLIVIRNQNIIDTRSKKEKEIRVYSIKTADGSVKRISGRTLLDRCADEIMDENGGFEVENRNYKGKGYEWFINREVKFIRGDDTRTKHGDQLGTYEILVAED